MSRKDNLQKTLEEQLASMHNRKYCVLVSRGVVAIYLAVKALGYTRGKVILPSILCFSPANAVIYAGMEPVFADVSRSDFNLDLHDVERILKKEKDVRAILLPHLFGQPADLDSFVQLAKRYNVRLIEDAAQSMGGSYKEKPLGSFGDLSVLSFGHTKIIDAGGGGALLFDDTSYWKPVRRLNAMLPLRAGNLKHLQEAYTKIYYALSPFARREPNFGRLYYPFPYIFRDLYLYRGLSEDIIRRISSGIRGLKRSVEVRNENASYYRKYLQHGSISHPKYRWDGVYWRYSFLIKGDSQMEIAEELRHYGVPVSNWYPPLHRYFVLEPKNLGNADTIGRHIFNLWVDPAYTREDIRKTSLRMLKIIDRHVVAGRV